MIALFGILSGIILSALEVVLDKRLWKRNKNEKLISTAIRLGVSAIMVLAGYLAGLAGIQLLSFAWVIASTFILLFDFVLNVSRWDKLPRPYNWRIQHNVKMNAWQSFLWKISKFTKRFFWHGDENTKSLWDKAFQRIPPQGELLIKGILFGLAIYFGV